MTTNLKTYNSDMLNALGLYASSGYASLPSRSSCMKTLDNCGDFIRKITPDLDFMRLMIVRGRRMLLLSSVLLKNTETHGPWLGLLDAIVQSFVVYQALVLMPRFMMNSLYVCQHIGTEDQKEKAKLTNMSWDMAYDLGWILNGMLSFFVFIGPLAPFALYLTVLTPTYHLLVHTTRYLTNWYYGRTQEDDPMDAMRLLVRIGVSTCVVSAAVIILVGCANPIVPFLAAALAVVATLAGKVLSDYLVKKAAETAPAPKLPEVLQSEIKDVLNDLRKEEIAEAVAKLEQPSCS